MGDSDDVAKMCEREAGRLIGYLINCGADRDDIPDTIQDTFIVLWEKGDEVTLHRNPAAYLYKIARGKARDRWRSN